MFFATWYTCQSIVLGFLYFALLLSYLIGICFFNYINLYIYIYI
jgi:hypothetical protein